MVKPDQPRVFDPQLADLMGRAFHAAWDALQAAGSVHTMPYRAQCTRETISACIIECAQKGERDFERLRDCALDCFRETAKSA